jgi:hypothetical protein
VQVGSFGEASKFVALKGDDFKNISGNFLHIYTLFLFSQRATHQVIEPLLYSVSISD